MESDIGIINYSHMKRQIGGFKNGKNGSRKLLLVSLMIFSMFLVQEFNISTNIRTIIRNEYDGINGRFLISAVGLPILAML